MHALNEALKKYGLPVTEQRAPRKQPRATEARSNNKLGVLGVSETKEHTYKAMIKFNGKMIHLGVWPTLEEAGAASKGVRTFLEVIKPL